MSKHFKYWTNLKPLNNGFDIVYKEEAMICYNLLMLMSAVR